MQREGSAPTSPVELTPTAVALPPSEAGGLRQVLAARLRQMLASHRGNLQTFLFLVAVNLFTAAVGIVTQVQIANTLGKARFGELAYGLSIAMFGQVVIRFGTDRTLVRDLIHYPEIFAELISGSLLLRYGLTLITVACLVAWKLTSTAPDVTWGLMLVIIGNSVLSLDLQPAYEALQRMQRHAVYFFLYKTAYFVIIWGIILLRPSSLSIPAIGVASLAAVVFYICLQHRWVMQRLPTRPDPTQLLRHTWFLAKRNFWVCLATMLGLFVTVLNQLVLKNSAGPAALGGYAAAMQLVLVGVLFLEQISRIGRPAVARYTRPDVAWNARVRFLAKYLAVMVLTVAPLGAAMILAPNVILKLIFKPEYASAAPTMKILGGYIVLYSIGLVASQYVISAGMDRTYMISVSLGCAVSAVLCAVLIPAWGSEGAAWALLCAHGLPIACYWLAVVRQRPKESLETVA